MFKELTLKAGLMVSKVGFGLKKKSPELFMATGIIGVAATVVVACKATLKIDDILDEREAQLLKIQEFEDANGNSEEYTADDAKKDRLIVKTQTVVKLTKLYAPAIGLGFASITCILASNNILKKRNAAIAAAYAAVDKSFKEYRDRVIDRFGEEVDQQLRYNIKPTEVEEKEVNEKGKEKTVRKTIEVADPKTSGYVKYFVKGNPNWENDEDYILSFLNAEQNYANDRLRAVGHLTLNEVYESLGFKKTKAGMVVGWFYDTKNPSGDNFVKFDVKRVTIPDENGNFDTGYAIDFNVDGNIYDRVV